MKSTRTILTAAIAAALIFAVACEKAKQVATRAKNATKMGQLTDMVNTQYEEFGPIISADGKTIFFTSNRPGGKGGEDVWKTTRNFAGLWTFPENVASLNTEKDEGLDAFTQDGKTVYMTSEDRPGGLGKNDIFEAHLEGKKWGDVHDVGAPIDTQYNDANASITPDGKTMYFVSDRPGGQGDYDIWVSHMGADGKWGNPENLGEPVNTDGWEGFVFIAPDGQTLYFSSNGLPGYGGADLFRSFLRDGKWSDPENLGPKVNTTGNDTYISLSGAGDKIYMSTTNEGGKGGNDIVVLPLPSQFEAKKIVVVAGKVLNSETGQPMKAWAKIKYRPTSRDLAVAETRPNGVFRIAVVPQKDLVLMVYTEAEGFSPWYEKLKLDLDKDNQVLFRNLLMAEGKKPEIAPDDWRPPQPAPMTPQAPNTPQ